MKCPVCDIEVSHLNKERVPCGHLVIVKSAMDDHIHVHGDLTNKPMMKEFLDAAKAEIKIEEPKIDVLSRKEFVFHNRQRIGDMIMFTCAIRDFKAAYPDTRVNVIATAPHIWDNNPYLDRTLVPTEENTIKIGPGKLTNASNRVDWHFANAFRVSIEEALNIHIPQGESRGDIWFTEEEYNAPRITERPYWIIIVGGEKGWGCKMYPFEKWQEFVSQNPDTLFYQLGSAGDNHPRLQGANVVDYIGKTENRDTGVRDLFKLFLNAEGSIGLVSFHMHLSGALHKPAIVVAGAREPVSFTRYPGHQYLSTDGCLPCGINACWHCNIDTCTNFIQGKEKVPKCVDMITPEDLTRALNAYYVGGRLNKDKPSEKPKLKNIVKTPDKIITAPKVDIVKYGQAWGGGNITEQDWEFLQKTIQDNNIKTVLAFGAALPTLLMDDMGIKVADYETVPEWITKIKSLSPKADIKHWDGFTPFESHHMVDMAFVDGPAGGANREMSTRMASELAKVVVIHDATREHERRWQDMYLKSDFVGPVKGGSKCHLWVRGEAVKSNPGGVCSTENVKPNEKSIIATKNAQNASNASAGGKFVKVVSTARGWGGCARSVTTIMKFLAQAGHKVEFIPFRNKVGSREYQEFFKEHPDIIVTETYDSLKESCDVLLMYADDYVWEFEQPGIVEVFSGLSAQHKIMMLNYRRGKVGSIPWTRGWDKYMFLNSTQEKDLLAVHPGVRTKVLPPCTELDEFLRVNIDYKGLLRVVRHSSQGDAKFPKDIGQSIQSIIAGRPDTRITMLPGPSFIPADNQFIKFPRTDDLKVIASFLSLGNLFWYSLPIGYMDMGPRVILEAMAAGLPIIADNWGGAVDRVTPECGWLCDTKEQMVEIINNVTLEELENKGKAARARAVANFIPARWIEEIINA